MASFPRDRFDDLPTDVDRVGAHRAPGKRGRGWARFGWGVLAPAVPTVAGIFALSLLVSRFELPFADGETPTPSASETVVETAAPVTDPSTLDPAYLAALTISVLNGTPTSGLSNTAADQIA